MRRIFAVLHDLLLELRANVKDLYLRARYPYPYFQGPEDAAKVIVYVPGVLGDWSNSVTLAKHFVDRDFQFYTPYGFGRLRARIVDLVSQLEYEVLKFREKEIFLIGHSRGGLVVKKFMDTNRNASLIKKAATIATPYGGLAWSSKRIRYFNELHTSHSGLQEMRNNGPRDAQIVNMYAQFDNHIPRQADAKHPHVRNLLIPVRGHMRILHSAETIKALDDFFL